jgi:hypothetical protein
MWFQLDGAPSHCREDIRQWLNVTHPGRWTGLGGSIARPPRSLDLTAMEFFLWEHLKEHVCAVSLGTIEYLVGKGSSSCNNSR